MSLSDPISVRIENAIAKVPAAQWDACAGGGNPFVSHGFLSALEESGSVTAETGWLPHHLTIRQADGTLAAALPLYLKSHSYGEYVFDWGWADAFERAGGSYYPKLQCSVPFTPVTGPRLLVRRDISEPEARRRLSQALIAAMVKLAEQHRISSVHITFPTQEEYELFGELDFLQRRRVQYHWENQDFDSFDDFLASLQSRKRKAIKKERRDVAAADITFETLKGDSIRPHHWDAFYRFYLATTDKKWGQAYLTREFFELMGARLADQVALIMASRNGRIIAGALNLIGGDTLFGRNWGAEENHRFLHFETCYYQAIETAIRLGLKRVEAGAQGEHKIQRGYLPTPTYSAHWITDPGFRRAVAHFLDREQTEISYRSQILAEHSPYRNSE